MPRIELRMRVGAPIQRCFDLSRDIDMHAESMTGSRERPVAGVTSGLIGLGQEVTWQAYHFGLRWQMSSRITEFERPMRFVDEMQQGPFAFYRHEHRFLADPAGTTVIDLVDYGLPFGPLGGLVNAVVAERYLRNLLEIRNRHLKFRAENASP